jgi:hypothetical protein
MLIIGEPRRSAKVEGRAGGDRPDRAGVKNVSFRAWVMVYVGSVKIFSSAALGNVSIDSDCCRPRHLCDCVEVTHTKGVNL